MIDLSTLPNLPQRQDALSLQLADIVAIAIRLGLYDAADAITQVLGQGEKVAYGCHCDLELGQEPDDCVIDSGTCHECIHAKEGMRKEQCEYWKIIVPKNEK